MRIAILSPNLSRDPSIVDIGVTYLATWLRDRTAHDVKIVDFTYHARAWRQHLARQIEAFKPDIVGISSVSMYMQYIRPMLREIKARWGLPTILGGYHASLQPEESIAEPDVDAICIGDGEYALTEYLDALQAGRSPRGIAGIWFKEGGSVVRNELREFIQDLESLPLPDYDLWEDIDRFLFYNGVIYVIGNRGCPYSCTYCSEEPLRERMPGRYLRTRDPRAYAWEIQAHWEKYRRRGMRVAHTFDPAFTVNRPWMMDFCDEYRQLGLAEVLPFSAFSRADQLDEEKVAALAAANLKIIRIGIEAGNERIRREVYHKPISDQQFREVFALLHRYGIAATGYNILGGPGESMATLRDTFRFARELEVDRPIFFTYRPLPTTRAAAMVEELGGHVDHAGWEGIDSLHERSNVYTKDLSPRQIELFRYQCLAYFTSKRVVRMLAEQRGAFLTNLVRYAWRARRDGLSLQYTVGYFMVSGGDNLTH